MLKEHGWFWWADEPIPQGGIAPSGYVSGVLSIDEEGRIEIELDGLLSNRKREKSGFFKQEIPPDRKIMGLLKNERRYIIAYSLNRDGGVSSNIGVSFDKYSALRCIITERAIPNSLRIRSIHFPLSGYEEWMGSQRFPVKINRNGLSLRRKPSRDLRASSEIGRVHLGHDLEARGLVDDFANGLFLNERSFFNFSPRRAVDIDEASRLNELIQDFFVVLTGSDYRATWPSISFTNGTRGKLYYLRLHSSAPPPARYDCTLQFDECDSQLCNLFFSWIRESEIHGAGIYLFLSNKRGLKAYTEQRFFTIISGLEAFHRSMYGDQETDSYKERISRILNDIENEKDRKWLQKRMKNAGAPSLEQRLRELFMSLPINFQNDILREFCISCASMRNSLAHHGHVGSRKESESSSRDAWLKIEIISRLYHLLILSTIGVDKNSLGRWVAERFNFYALRWYLERAKLVDGWKDAAI